MKLTRLAAATVLAGGLTLAGSSEAGAWLHRGSTTQYPSTGGTWQYGWWDATVRSYYYVGRCHGSSVSLNGDLVRSVNTAANHWSIAEKGGAFDWWGADDRYYYRVC
jgi:hypothetical protein